MLLTDIILVVKNQTDPAACQQFLRAQQWQRQMTSGEDIHLLISHCLDRDNSMMTWFLSELTSSNATLWDSAIKNFDDLEWLLCHDEQKFCDTLIEHLLQSPALWQKLITKATHVKTILEKCVYNPTLQCKIIEKSCQHLHTAQQAQIIMKAFYIAPEARELLQRTLQQQKPHIWDGNHNIQHQLLTATNSAAPLPQRSYSPDKLGTQLLNTTATWVSYSLSWCRLAITQLLTAAAAFPAQVASPALGRQPAVHTPAPDNTKSASTKGNNTCYLHREHPAGAPIKHASAQQALQKQKHT